MSALALALAHASLAADHFGMKTLIMLFFFLSTFKLQAQELSLLIIKSPGLNWSSPRALTKTTVDAANSSFGLGHVSLAINCQAGSALTGIANRSSSETRNAVLKQGNGLGVLFRLFEGSLETGKYTISNFERMAKSGRGRFLTFKISEATCQRLLDYKTQYDELQALRRSQGKKIYYGFPALSRLGEGAGCSGHALSYLEVAGLKESWMLSAWSRFLRVPKSDVGYPMRNNHVGIRHMLYSSSQGWSTASGSHFPLFLWDPDLMFKHVGTLIDGGVEEVGELHGARGIILDRSTVATPGGPLFLGDVLESPTDPLVVYRDLMELERRWRLSRER